MLLSTCNGKHCWRWPGKDGRGEYKLFQCVCAGCLHCVKVCVVIDKVPVSSKSDHHHYTPMEWADWTLEHLRTTIEEVELLIAALSSRATSDQQTAVVPVPRRSMKRNLLGNTTMEWLELILRQSKTSAEEVQAVKLFLEEQLALAAESGTSSASSQGPSEVDVNVGRKKQRVK